MRVVNLMPHPLTIFAAIDTRPAGPKGYVLVREAKPIMVVPSSGISRAACVETPVGQIDGVPVFRNSYGEPENVPDPEDGVMYVVSSITAQACREAGRTTKDLLLPARTVRDSEGRVIGCTAFSVL